LWEVFLARANEVVFQEHASPLKRPRAAVTLAVFLGALIAILPGLGAQNVWSRDEARPALVAKEMLATGQWAVPHIGGRIYTAKPPLFPAIVALVSPRRVSEWSLRTPSAVAAALTVAMTYVLGSHLMGSAAGVTAAAILASSVTFYHWARTGRMEMLLVLFITLGCWSLVCWLETGRARHAGLLGVWIGLGILTKGPMALLPAAIGVIVVGLGPRPPRLRAHAGLCGLAMSGIVLLWLGAAWLTSNDFPAYIRALPSTFYGELTVARSRNMLLLIAGGFFPWTLTLPAAAVLVHRSWRSVGPALIVPAVWAATTFGIVATTLSPRDAYFLPVYPALALLVAGAWHVARDRWLAGLFYPLGITGLGLVLLTTALTLSGGSLAVPIGHGGIGLRGSASTFAIGLFLLLAVTVVYTCLRAERRTLAALGTAVGILGVFIFVETGLRAPAVNRRLPTREAAARLAAAIPAKASVAHLQHHYLTALAFYLPHRSIQVSKPTGFGALRGRRDVFLLLTEDEMPVTADGQPIAVVPIARECFDDTCYFVAAFAGG
jgi:hypothetical protein